MGTIDLLLPTPLRGSGGHRTIVSNAEAVADRGHRVRIHVQQSRRIRGGADKTRAWFGGRRCEFTDGWPSSLPDSDAVMATTWFTADPVARMKTPATKLYFVQDYDPLFHPAGDVSVAAAGTFTLGLGTVVIGRWLQHKLLSDHGVMSSSLPFTADLERYRPGTGPRQRRIVAVLQPEKPRRCADLVAETLRRVMRSRGVEVLTIGGAHAPQLGPGHQHLGIVDIPQLARLYRSARVGLCISASNPSRVPFEMMASGLPVVEVALPNTVFDFPEDGCLLAYPDPDSLALALENLLDDDELHGQLSTGGSTYMKNRPQSLEAAAFIEFVESQLDHRVCTTDAPKPVYERPAILAAHREPWEPHHRSRLGGWRRGS